MIKNVWEPRVKTVENFLLENYCVRKQRFKEIKIFHRNVNNCWTPSLRFHKHTCAASDGAVYEQGVKMKHSDKAILQRSFDILWAIFCHIGAKK